MGAKRRTSIELSAREAVAEGSPFSPRGPSISDPGVALDEVMSLRASQEPIVLRVKVVAGGAWARELLHHDWLCDEGGAEPVRLPRPAWGFSQLSARWAARMRWIDAWERCRVPGFLLAAAASMPSFREAKLLALAAADCAMSARHLLPPEAESAAARLDSWRCGGAMEASRDDLEACYAAQMSADALPVRLACSSLYLALSVARGAPDVGPSSRLLHHLANAADEAEAASGRRDLAAVVRRRVPAVKVLRAAAAGGGA